MTKKVLRYGHLVFVSENDVSTSGLSSSSPRLDQPMKIIETLINYNYHRQATKLDCSCPSLRWQIVFSSVSNKILTLYFEISQKSQTQKNVKEFLRNAFFVHFYTLSEVWT